MCVLVNHVIEAISWQFYKVSVRNWGCSSGGKGFGDRLVGLVVVGVTSSVCNEMLSYDYSYVLY